MAGLEGAMISHDDKVPVAQATARHLQEMIRSGELKRGEKMPSQRVLSDRLKVSRPTLREALLTLETLGLVRTLPARGTFVVDPEGEDRLPSPWRYDGAFSIGDVFQSRLLIETELCRLAAGHLGAADLDVLEHANATFESAWNQGDLVAHVEADLRLHETIARACPNRMLWRLYQSVQSLLTESQRQPVPNTACARMAQSIAEHRQIIAALRAGDGAGSAAAMGAHIRNTASSAGIVLA
ncbi:FadR/GntR family transcriptional regulator [Rhodovulum visakhapatnamense]|nr:FCD domain-containing protein [Rhodovulum visakhapatnamense]